MMKKRNSFACRKSQLLKIAAFAVFASLAPSMSFAVNDAQIIQQQSQKVVGTVKDAAGEPVIGATIRVVGQQGGTVTDIDGNFAIDATAGQTLEITAIGYKTQQVKVSGRSIAVVVEEDALGLDEVVVLGYGAQARKQDLSASVGVVENIPQLQTRAIQGATAMLQGQIPGVTVQNDGAKGANMVIRGKGSNKDAVLWVVDGIPGAAFDMDDVESIVVLKDAASAAIYGAQSGAGGVVLVTTKRAKKGETHVSYNGTFGVKTPTNLIHGLTAEEEIEMRRQSYSNAGLSLPDAWNPTVNPWIATTRTDWVDEIFRDAVYQRHNVALESGSESSQHRLSLNVSNIDGTLINTYNKDISVKYTGNFELGKYVSVGEDLYYGNSSSRSTDTDSGYSGTYMSAIYMPSSATVYNPLDGTYGGTTTEDPAYIAQYGSNFADAHGDAINPVRLLEAANIYNKNNAMRSTTTLTIKNIVTGLKFMSRLSYFQDAYFYKGFTPIRDEVGKPELSNSLYEESTRTDQWKTENTLTYDNTFGKHTVGALAAVTTDYYKLRGFNATGNGFASEVPYLQYLKYANGTSTTDWLTGPDANVALIGRLSYSFDDRYFVTASLRKDWAGRLPEGHNSGTFPAFTAAWKISNESFFPKNDAINLLKLRASWGKVGNLGSIGMNYKSATLSTSMWNEQAWYGAETNQVYGNFVYLSRFVNESLTWENSNQFNVGIDAAFLKDRLSVSADFFIKKTKDLIQEQTTGWPKYIGFDARMINLGEVSNRGFELTATWRDKIGSDFNYWVSGNVAFLKNWISDIGGDPETVWQGGGGYRLVDYCYQSHLDGPMDEFYLVKSNGVIKNDADLQEARKAQPNAQLGDLWFVDADKDGTIDPSKDRQYVGSATPEVTYNLQGGFDWRKFSFGFQLQGVGGAQAYNIAKYSILSDVEGEFNRSSEILNAWSPSNTGSDIPRLSKNDPNGNWTTPSTYYLENASYLRLKNLTIGYDLTDALRSIAHFNDRGSRLKVSVSGENLFTITNYSGVDPECGGYDALKYPLSRVFALNIQLTY